MSVSTDMGATWTLTRKLTLSDLAVTVNGGTETWFGATSTGLYRSTDRGQTWGAVTLPAPALSGAAIQGVAASPPAGGLATVLVSVKGKGLYRSTDGGTTFSGIAPGLLARNEQLDTYNFRNTGSPIVFSPSFATDHTVFGFSHDHVLRSVDGGTSWAQLPVPTATHGPVFPVVPAAPTLTTATTGKGSITVAFTPPPDSGTPITRFDAICTSNDGGVTATRTGARSPIVVTGATNFAPYTCRVTATNALGTSPPSAPQRYRRAVGAGDATHGAPAHPGRPSGAGLVDHAAVRRGLAHHRLRGHPHRRVPRARRREPSRRPAPARRSPG